MSAARRIFFAGILAGLVAGLVATGLQSAKVTPLILAAEALETPHTHEGEHAWEPEGAQRLLFTALANILVGVGFGLLLSAGLALRQSAGAPVDARRGVLWGVAGFAAFALAPALGLPPELPGAASAALGVRQAWWLLTAIATSGGLALIAFAARTSWKALGLVLLVLPHAIGAPAAPHAQGGAPAELAAQFAVTSLAAAALFWIVLGGACGWLHRRLARAG